MDLLAFGSILFHITCFLGGSFANQVRTLCTIYGPKFTRTACDLNEREQEQDEKIGV
jgi:hypothetical protein